MDSYLFLWNPKKDPDSFKGYQALLDDARSGRPYTTRWICPSKRPTPGDIAIVQRTGAQNNGVFAMGTVTRGQHERADGVRVVNLSIDSFLPLGEEISRQEILAAAQYQGNWMPMASGNVIPTPIAKAIQRIWRRRSAQRAHLHAEKAEDDCAEELFGLEGQVRHQMSAHLHRERALREQKITDTLRANGRLLCEVPGCGFDFQRTYGSLGAGYAQVHHLQPLARTAGSRITRLSDLAIVCANCHAMIHRGGECHALDALIPVRSP